MYLVSYHNRKIIYLIDGKRRNHRSKAFYGYLAFALSIVNLQNKVFLFDQKNDTNFL